LFQIPSRIRIEMPERRRGTVLRVGDFNRFAFISSPDSRGRIEEFFASRREVEPDCIGRKTLNLGDEVSFTPGDPEDHRTHKVALEIRRMAAETEIDLTSYREIGVVDKIETAAQYFLVRREGPEGVDYLPFFASSVITGDAEEIKLGDWVEYAIETHNHNGVQKFHAIDVCTFTTEPEVCAVVPPEDPEQIYTPAECKLTLRQLISRK
jgi:hypothetical protein